MRDHGWVHGTESVGGGRFASPVGDDATAGEGAGWSGWAAAATSGPWARSIMGRIRSITLRARRTRPSVGNRSRCTAVRTWQTHDGPRARFTRNSRNNAPARVSHIPRATPLEDMMETKHT